MEDCANIVAEAVNKAGRRLAVIIRHRRTDEKEIGDAALPDGTEHREFGPGIGDWRHLWWKQRWFDVFPAGGADYMVIHSNAVHRARDGPVGHIFVVVNSQCPIVLLGDFGNLSAT